MELTPVSGEQFNVKTYTFNDYKKDDVIDNGSVYRDELIAQYQKQLDNIFNRDVDFHKDFYAVKQLVKLQGRQVYSDSDTFFEKLELKIKAMLKDKYKRLREEKPGERYPIVVFFETVKAEIKPYEDVFYLKYHGMTTIKRMRFSQRLSNLDEVDRYPVLNSFGYAATEIFLVFCYCFGTYMRFASDRIDGFDDYCSLIEKTYTKFQELMVTAVESRSGSRSLDTFVNSLKDLYLIGSEVGKIDKYVDIVEFFQECYKRVCRKIVENLCQVVNDEDTLFFKALKERMSRCEEINEKLKNEGFPLIEVERIVVFAATKKKRINQTLRNIILDCYSKQDIKPLLEVTELCASDDISPDWSDASERAFTKILKNVNIPNEDKLKEMVKYFDSVNEVLKKLQIFEQITDMSLRDQTYAFESLWKNNFRRDILNHLAFYADYKLKNMIKLRDRNKFEEELEKVSRVSKFLLELLERNNKIKFRRKYLTLYIQRMVNSLFEDDFTIYTNVCDCEYKMMRCLDIVYAKQAIGEVNFVNIHEEMVKAHEIYERTKLQVPAKVIGMKHVEDIGSVNEEGDSEGKLENEIISVMKEYKRVLKKELKELRVISSDTKVKLELSFRYSKFDLDYEGVIVRCNLYQCLILRMFNEFNDGVEIDIEEFVKNLGFSRKSIERELAFLSSAKTPVLVCGSKGWKINEDYFKGNDVGKIIVIK
ncbi:hypothetical protein CANINC_001169 [Pichia inconspicua]|uniref:Cullin family profile domain-containing protein n=1 Tax=Pichia inconspicua TaxID=52247 RepID=A0A4T0X4G1_9ASCO|nr:hypothetical protein CANINC_001169 [[Candida] inconspicua]